MNKEIHNYNILGKGTIIYVILMVIGMTVITGITMTDNVKAEILNEDRFFFHPDDMIGQPGDDIAIRLMLENTVQIQTYGFRFFYDNTAFIFTKDNCESDPEICAFDWNGSAAEAGNLQIRVRGFDEEAGEVGGSAASVGCDPGISPGEHIAITIQMQIKEDAFSGDYDFDLTVGDLNDCEGSAIDTVLYDGVFTITGGGDRPIPNNPPSKPIVDGTTTGNVDTNYTYSAVSTDEDNNSISYTFDWDDGDITTTDFLPSGTMTNATHEWTEAGLYKISVEAIDQLENDSGTPSGKTYLTVLIDIPTIDIDDIGQLLDLDNDSIYDTFLEDITKNTTDVEQQEDGKYLIDSDGDGEYDYTYDSEAGLEEIESEEEEEEQEEKQTPGFESIIIIFAITLVLLFLFRKKTKN